MLQAGITNKGDGFIVTQDKAGYKANDLGPEGVYTYETPSIEIREMDD